MVLVAQTHALYTAGFKFSKWVTSRNEMARNHPKHEFWTQSSGLGMFFAKKQKMVLVAQTHALYATGFPFSKWVTSGNEMARNNPKHEFWT